MRLDRRQFIYQASKGIGGISAVSFLPGFTNKNEMTKSTSELFFKISLAEWSLNRTLFSGKLKNMEFPAKAKKDFGIHAVEYVNQFFMDKAEDEAYLQELKSRTADLDEPDFGGCSPKIIYDVTCLRSRR